MNVQVKWKSDREIREDNKRFKVIRLSNYKTKYIAKIDDVDIIDFDKLVSTLNDIDIENNKETIVPMLPIRGFTFEIKCLGLLLDKLKENDFAKIPDQCKKNMIQ